MYSLKTDYICMCFCSWFEPIVMFQEKEHTNGKIMVHYMMVTGSVASETAMVHTVYQKGMEPSKRYTLVAGRAISDM